MQHATARRADQLGDAWASRRFSVELDLGLATPVGFAGVMLDVALVRWASIGCGVGTTLIALELACMSHVRVLTSPEEAFSFGAGLSVGRYVQTRATRYGALNPLLGTLGSIGHAGSWPSEYEWKKALWLNVEAGYEWRFDSGFTWRVYAGLSTILNPNDAEPHPSEPSPGQSGTYDHSNIMPYLGGAWGYAF
jgi:hypothetical protein